jgi:hypothetical protein
MKPSAVGVEEGHDVNGRDLHLERDGISEAVVPNFIGYVAEKLGHTSLGCLITGVVIESGFVGGLRTNVNNCPDVISNHLVVEWETSQAYKFGTMIGFVLDTLGELAARE